MIKNKFFTSLLAKLTFGQIFALFFLTSLAGWQFHNLFQYAADRAEQISGWHTATQLVPHVENILKVKHNYWQLQLRLAELLALSPKTEIYILDRFGKIIADSGGQESFLMHRLPLDDIHLSLSSEGSDIAPIYGLNPRDTEKKTLFSAAQFNVYGKSFYIYAIIVNDNFLRANIVSKVEAIYRAGVGSIIVLVVTSIIFGTILFYLLTNRLRKTLTVLTEFREGNFSKRLSKNQAQDEIGMLMTTINSMADSIEDNLSQLRHKDNLRRELIANISHDLRSPAALISGLSEVMQIETDLPEETKEKCKLINDSCRSINKLLIELFELARFEAKETKPEMMNFSIEELVEDMTSIYQPISKKKGVNFVKQIVNDISFVYGDPTMIGRVLTNLIDNALRYTPEGGTVTLSLKFGDMQSVEVGISDTGVGIPQEQLSQVFQRYYQVNHDDRSENGLSGLGLAIVKKIIEAHGSEIRVDSIQGSGTTFTFTLPIARN